MATLKWNTCVACCNDKAVMGGKNTYYGSIMKFSPATCWSRGSLFVKRGKISKFGCGKKDSPVRNGAFESLKRDWEWNGFLTLWLDDIECPVCELPKTTPTATSGTCSSQELREATEDRQCFGASCPSQQCLWSKAELPWAGTRACHLPWIPQSL